MNADSDQWKINANLTYENFIVFEPASLRIDKKDILLQGSEVVSIFQHVKQNYAQKNSLKDLILSNRLQRIGIMLDLVSNYDTVIMTKFISKIWRRYTYLSQLGENFITVSAFNDLFPAFIKDKQELLGKRSEYKENTPDLLESMKSKTDSTNELNTCETS